MLSSLIAVVPFICSFKANAASIQIQKYNKHIPINEDLYDLLVQMGYENKKHSEDYILFPERKVKTKTIMNDWSKAFTNYLKEAGVEKEVSLKNLIKTYITWVNRVMGKNTGILTSHGGEHVLKDYYLDGKILSAIEEAALKVSVFGVQYVTPSRHSFEMSMSF